MQILRKVHLGYGRLCAWRGQFRGGGGGPRGFHRHTSFTLAEIQFVKKRANGRICILQVTKCSTGCAINAVNQDYIPSLKAEHYGTNNEEMRNGHKLKWTCHLDTVVGADLWTEWRCGYKGGIEKLPVPGELRGCGLKKKKWLLSWAAKRHRLAPLGNNLGGQNRDRKFTGDLLVALLAATSLAPSCVTKW